MVACTDETVWFIHRDVIDEYYKRETSTIYDTRSIEARMGLGLCNECYFFLDGKTCDERL